MDGNIWCRYTWNIHHISNRNEILQSPGFKAEGNDSIMWVLRFRPPFYNNSRENASVQLVATSTNELTYHGTYFGTVTMHLNSMGMKLSIFDEKKFVLKMDNPLKTYINDGILSYTFNLSPLESTSMYVSLNLSSKPSDLTVICEISYCKQYTYLTLPLLPSNIYSIPFKLNTISNPLEDFGKLYLSEEHSDVTIYINFNGKQSKYPAHKIVLAVRSKVFEAMLKHGINYVVVEDIREEVFLEVLRYIYTGQVTDQNLNSMVYELLPVADKYDLEKLKIACSNVLRGKLSVQTVLKIVTLAHMHSIADLKIDAIKFIKDHSTALARTMDSKEWGDLMARPYLMKDLLLSYMNN